MRVDKARRPLAFALVTASVFVATWSAAVPAQAAIPEVSAFITGPSPSQIPAGSTTSATAQFSLSADVGAITVSIELQGPGGFGALRLATATTTSELANCVEAATAVTCDWDGEAADGSQTLGVLIDIDPGVTPGTNANLVAIVSSATIPDTDTYATFNLSTLPPVGSTSISGTVITEGGGPADGACIYLLSSPFFVYQAVADANGNWSFTGLPDNYSFVVAVVPPFVGSFGPCAENGPPPIPGPGELQPVFFDDIWIDLSDPTLTGGQGNPYDFAVNAGATVLDSTTSGIESCLSTAPSTAVPRPACIAAPTTTSTTTAPASTTTTDPTEVLPATGIDMGGLLFAGMILLLAGWCVLAAGRRDTIG